MKNNPDQSLFADFPDISTESWIEKIRADLKGADSERKLLWNTDEGFAVKPFYRKEDLDGLEYLDNIPAMKPEAGAPNGWIICQDLNAGQVPEEINHQIRIALKGGAQALRLHLNQGIRSRKDSLQKILEGIALSEIEIHYQAAQEADALHELLLEYAKSVDLDPLLLKGSLGADPLGQMASSGSPLAFTENLGTLVKTVKNTCPELRAIDVNGTLIQNTGSTLVEELAFTLAMANEYLTILSSQGVRTIDAIRSLQISMSSGPNYFMEIAKLRAARILWAGICEGYGIAPERGKIRIHSISSQWNMTLYDPYVNMLRGTTEAMSSILGGADLVTVLPFDHPGQKSSAFSDRIARSVQIILRDEAYLERVSDPAAGSYYIEKLTDSIAEQAWELFRETESKGGFIKAFKAGWIQEKVLQSRKVKVERVASGKTHLLGTNAFPNFNEMILQHTRLAETDESSDTPLQALRPLRVSAMFEKLRLETESCLKPPRVFLLKYGSPPWRSARASFSGNFFACAGYKILDFPAFDSVEKGIVKALETGAEIVVLCSSDDGYTGLTPSVISALNEKAITVVAGFPSEGTEGLREAGIEHFIHLKSNLLQTLRQFNKLLVKS